MDEENVVEDESELNLNKVEEEMLAVSKINKHKYSKISNIQILVKLLFHESQQSGDGDASSE